MEIIQSPVPSHGDRKGSIPIIIVNHVSAGSMKSMYNHFSNPNNEASSTFGVGRDGSIVQYVPIERKPWTQGRISLKDGVTAPIIRQLMGDPNKYAVSIESEGYLPDKGVDGSKTEEQFLALCWLHKWIQTEVLRIYGTRISLNSHQVLGHFQIDPIGKPLCPGLSFPWTRLYSELAVADQMSFEEYDLRIEYLGSNSAKRALAFAAAERVDALGVSLTIEKWKSAASTKLMYLAEVTGCSTPEAIIKRVKELYTTALNVGTWQDEAIRKLLLIADVMKQRGLL